MKQPFLILLVMVLVVGAALFYDQVLAIFHGMSALEAMRTILTFVLHVAVVTIASYVAFTLPEIFKPWLQMLRWKRRASKRVPHPQSHRHTPERQKALTADQLLRLYMMQSLTKSRRPGPPAPPPSQDDIHLNF